MILLPWLSTHVGDAIANHARAIASNVFWVCSINVCRSALRCLAGSIHAASYFNRYHRSPGGETPSLAFSASSALSWLASETSIPPNLPDQADRVN
jgi:hypothetical protein